MTPAEAKALNVLREHVKKHNIGYSMRTRKGYRDPNGSPEGTVYDPNQLVGIHASTHILVKDMADLLTKRYPGFRWAIQPNEQGQVFNIFCLDFHGIWGYVIKYTDVMNDPKRREAIKAGREILRRFRYRLDRYDLQEMALIPRDMQGQAIPDVSGLKRSRFTKQAELNHLLATGKARVVGAAKGGHIIEVVESRARK
jgi:hypothetical protein